MVERRYNETSGQVAPGAENRHGCRCQRAAGGALYAGCGSANRGCHFWSTRAHVCRGFCTFSIHLAARLPKLTRQVVKLFARLSRSRRSGAIPVRLEALEPHGGGCIFEPRIRAPETRKEAIAYCAIESKASEMAIFR
jgi:hypothetical protein